MIKKNPQEFQESAIKHNISRWPTHDCSICGYKCGYVFSPDKRHVGYDSGCDCVSYHAIRHADWERVAKIYNEALSPDERKEADVFWGFNEEFRT